MSDLKKKTYVNCFIIQPSITFIEGYTIQKPYLLNKSKLTNDGDHFN